MQNLKLNHFYSYVNTASAIIQSYDGSIPFAHFIKDYFSRNKKFGSRDRKYITQFCYSYFRLGRSYPQCSVHQKILKGLECTGFKLDPTHVAVLKGAALPQDKPQKIFNYDAPLSEHIDQAAFEQSHLVQPDLFLRIRPGNENAVINKLQLSAVNFTVEGNSVRLPNSFKAESVIAIDREAVIQDLNSQNVGTLLKLYKEQAAKDAKIKVWDCCAASGGKSILAKDILSDIELTVSDLRPSIISNLRRRFEEAGIKRYKSFVTDATKARPDHLFDLIIADVPCSGSGTWARTPEQLLFFSEDKIGDYAALQRAILSNVIKYLKPGGYLLYITCSVFRQENEDQVHYLQEQGVQAIQQQVFKGYEIKADTMFGALLRK